MDKIVFDLNVTRQCNMRCTYCVEADSPYEAKDSSAIVPDFCSFVDRILASGRGVSIGFWGGEPTLRPDVMMNVIDRYLNNPYVQFAVYTNGVSIPSQLQDLIVSMKDMKAFGTESKFLTQISYDGQPIHDLKRRRVGGQSTSEDVLKGIQWAITSEIPFTLKSTITIDTFKHLYEAYRDFNALVGTNKFMYGQGYFPTVDYFNDVVGGDETLNGYIEDLKANMKQIAAFMIQERRAGRNPIDFSWFGDNRADCVAGVNLFSVDIDGRIFVCHGCFYTSKKEDHYVGRVTDDINVLKISQEKHGPYVHKNPAECATCEATFCVRCNTVRYSVSEKPTYEERWKDYTNNPNLCRIYKEAGKISRAFRKIMEGVTL